MRVVHAQLFFLLALLTPLLANPLPLLAQGAYLSAGGPVHRSMGGASTAAPLDAIGAMYWNPATISGLQANELGVGLDFLYSNHSISSTIGGASGTTYSENGFTPIPTVGWAHHLDESPVTLGLFIGGVAGFKTNVNADPNNPVLAALGRISSEATFLQLAPAISVALSEQLSVAAGPVVTMGQLAAEPFVFDTPNTNGQYPSGRASRYHWGGGAQIGMYYIVENVHLGASVKTPAWMEQFRFFGEDAAGAPRVLRADVDLPLILSFGSAYTGIENWEFAADLHYFDYGNADGFGDDATFDSTARVPGLGWKSVLSLALGAQYRWSDNILLRSGYTYNQNPMGDNDTMFNLASPLLYEHMLSGGASWMLSENVSLNAAYSYFFLNETTGPVVFPGVGAIPGSSVSQDMDAHVVSLGISVAY